MPWIEFTSQPQIKYSNLEGFMGSRFFKVWGGVTKNTIILNPESVVDDTGIPLPAYDSTWPNSQGFVTSATLEAYEVTPIEDDVLHVRAIYSDRRFRGEYGSAFQTEVENIPYAYRSPFVQTGGSFSGWLTDAFTMNATYFRIRKTKYVTLPDSNLDPTTMIDRPVSKQVNKLHNLGGANELALWARFEGADTQKLTYDRYRVSYSWVVDSGIKYSTESIEQLITLQTGAPPYVISANMSFFPEFESKLYRTSGWFRAPFEEVKLTRPLLDETGAPLSIETIANAKPLFYARMRYDYSDPDGWTRLP